MSDTIDKHRRRTSIDETTRALLQAAQCHLALDEHADALVLFRSALEHAESAGEPALVAQALHGMGTAHRGLDEPAPAARAFERAHAIAVAAGDRRGVARSARALAGIAAAREEPATAIELLSRSLAISEELGDLRGAHSAASDIGAIHLALGDLEGAYGWFGQCAGYGRKIADPRLDIATHEKLGEVLSRMGRADEARSELDQAREIARRLRA